MDFEILTEAEADILHLKRYSSYRALLRVNTATQKYLMELILSPVKITEEYRRDAIANLKKYE